jgi:hypothetical protein
MLSSLRLGFQSGVITSGFPTCRANLNKPDLAIHIILDVEITSLRAKTN